MSQGESFARVAALELSLLSQTGGAHLTRKHMGARIFGAEADQKRRISTSAGTASLAHLVLTQVEQLGFCVDDSVVLRAEIELAPLGDALQDAPKHKQQQPKQQQQQQQEQQLQQQKTPQLQKRRAS